MRNVKLRKALFFPRVSIRVAPRCWCCWGRLMAGFSRWGLFAASLCHLAHSPSSRGRVSLPFLGSPTPRGSPTAPLRRLPPSPTRSGRTEAAALPPPLSPSALPYYSRASGPAVRSDVIPRTAVTSAPGAGRDVGA